jgi:predicted nucleic acid-binding protein
MAVIDTSFLIDLDRSHPAAHDAYKLLAGRDEVLLLPAHAAMEYLAGYEEPALNLEDLERSFRLVPFGRNHILQSANLARKALSTGDFPGWDDTAIAATAVMEASYILSANPAHFAALGCRVWDYRNERTPPALD